MIIMNEIVMRGAQTAAPGMELTDVTVFIDMNRQAMQHPSA